MAALTMACGPTSAGRADISCKVEGAKAFAAGMNEAAICAEFRDAFHANISPAELKTKEAVKAAIAVSDRGEISVNISEKKAGVETNHPVIAVAVFDRAMNKNDIRVLAKEAASLLRQ